MSLVYLSGVPSSLCLLCASNFVGAWLHLFCLCVSMGVGWPCEWHKSGSSLSSLKVRSLIEVAGAMGMAGVGTSAHESQTEYLPLSHGSWCVKDYVVRLVRYMVKVSITKVQSHIKDLWSS